MPRARISFSVFAVSVTLLVTLGATAAILAPTETISQSVAASQPKPYQWPGGRAPIGVTLSGLQAYVMSPRVITMVEHQVRASKTYWHADTVRFQIIQDRLVGPHGHTRNPGYMAAITAVTQYALRQHLTVVLNAQTELTTGYGSNESLPTHATRAFWQYMISRWGNNPHVVFDLFNEPRYCNWAMWHTAFQRLVNYIRRSGARNQIWAEGLWWGSTLAGVPLLRGSNIVYSFHKPGGPWPWKTHATRAVWQHAFGYLADQGIPVVDGEFGNYAGSFHWKAHPVKTVRKYLAFLTAHHIGMLAWSLIPGSLNSTLNYDSVSHEPEGDGALVRAWFTQPTGR